MASIVLKTENDELITFLLISGEKISENGSGVHIKKNDNVTTGRGDCGTMEKRRAIILCLSISTKKTGAYSLIRKILNPPYVNDKNQNISNKYNIYP
jgi:hypothetical protein